MKRIDCKKKCKKTSMLKGSKFCEGFALYEDGQIRYSCETNLESATEKEKSFYNCDFYDMEEYSQCYKCPLSCKKNKSKIRKNKESQISKANRILDNISDNYPISPGAIEFARNNLDNELSEQDKEAIKIVDMASNLLNRAMSGGKVNASMIKLISDFVRAQSKKK